MSKQRVLRVFPNPFHALDHDGYPACALPHEPVGDGVTTFDDRRFIGATLCAKMLQKFPQGSAQHSTQETWFEFSDEPTPILSSPYYKHAMARNEIIPADEESARVAGVAFIEPAVRLEQLKREAIQAWTNQNHEEHDDVPPEELLNFSFGPMKKVAAKEAPKSETVHMGFSAPAVSQHGDE